MRHGMRHEHEGIRIKNQPNIFFHLYFFSIFYFLFWNGSIGSAYINCLPSAESHVWLNVVCQI